MGVVYLARQLELERDVALKVISPELTEDALARGRFLAEASAAAAVEHPNVVPVHAVGTEDDRAYLVMRFIRGDDLRDARAPRRPVAAAAGGGDRRAAGRCAGRDPPRGLRPPRRQAAQRADRRRRARLPERLRAGQGGAGHPRPTSEDHWVGTLDYVAPEQIRGEPVDGRDGRLRAGRRAVLHAHGPAAVRPRRGRGQALGAPARGAAAAVRARPCAARASTRWWPAPSRRRPQTATPVRASSGSRRRRSPVATTRAGRR